MKRPVWLLTVLATALLLTACTTPAEPTDTDDTTTTDPAVTTTTTGDSADPTDGTTTTTTQKSGGGTSTTAPQGNEVDWGALFGDDTTTTKKGDTTTTTTTTTTKPTTTTTLKPTVVDKVSLPAVGTDVDTERQKGRIKISKVELKGQELTIEIRNCTDEQSSKWITEETDYVTYACYDKNGKELAGNGDYFGYIYLGCLEVGETVTDTIHLPEGTAEVRITGSKIVYWTPWS